MPAKPKSKQAEALQLLDDLDSFTPVDAAPSESASNGAGASNPRTSTSSSVKPNSAGAGSGANEGETAEALAFLDEIQQKASEPASRPSSTVHGHGISRSGTPTVRKSTERVKLGGGTPSSLLPGASSSSTSLHKQSSLSTTTTGGGDSGAKGASEQTSPSSGPGWGWGSVWNTASAAIQQAKSAVDEQVKYLPQVQIPKNEQARKWGEGVIEYAKNAQLDKLGMAPNFSVFGRDWSLKYGSG